MGRHHLAPKAFSSVLSEVCLFLSVWWAQAVHDEDERRTPVDCKENGIGKFHGRTMEREYKTAPVCLQSPC